MSIQIFNNKIKPNFENMDIKELKNLYKLKTKNICKINDKTLLINELINFWKNNPLHEDIDCAICMELVTNGDHMITECNHYYHSSCYFKYINSNINNYIDNKDTNSIKSIFKCPKCRNNLIENNLDNIENNNENEDEDEEIDINNNLTNINGIWTFNSNNLFNHQPIMINNFSYNINDLINISNEEMFFDQQIYYNNIPGLNYIDENLDNNSGTSIDSNSSVDSEFSINSGNNTI